MTSYSQSLLQSGVSTRNHPLVPSGEIDITNSVPMSLPHEIWDKIFSYIGFQDLKLFTEHKIRILKKSLSGNEDNNRLMMGEKFIFHKKDFLKVVRNIYNLALCCKEFYRLTQQERKLLINAAQWARFDRQFLFSEQTPIRNKQDENIRFKIDTIQETVRAKDSMTSLYRDPIPKLPLETFSSNVINEILMGQTSKLMV